MVNLSFNLDELRKIANGDDNFLKDMVALFITQTENSLREIDTEMENREFQKVFSALHKMKPSIQVMGITTVIQIIQKTEEMKTAGVDVVELKEQLTLIREKLNQVLKELRG